MNILQILPELKSGGVETGTIDLARVLIKNGHKAIVISAGGALVSDLEKMGATHYVMPVHEKSLWPMFKCVQKVRQIIKDEAVDIVHARSRVPAWIGYWAAKCTEAVFLTTCHGYYSNHFFSKIMGWGKLVIVISQIIGWHMVNDFKVPREKIRLIYRGVDLNKFRFKGIRTKENSAEKVIGIIARITPLKGHVYFIKSLPNIFKEFPKARALIIGSAPSEREQYLDELKELVEKLGFSEKVEFTGAVSDIPKILEKLDVLVMATTTEEAFGRVIIEAGAIGVPVVATKVGGVVEIIEHEKNGLLVEPTQPFQIAQAVIRLFKDKQLAQNCVKNMRKKVEDNFSLKTLAEKVLAVYDELLTKKKILIIKLGAFGDVVLISAALKACRKKFPQATIEVLIRDEFKDVLQSCPYIDDLIIVKSKGIRELVRITRLLHKKGFDMSIDFHNNNLSHILAFVAEIPKRYGYKNKKMGAMLNCGIADSNLKVDPLTHQFAVLKSLGIEQDDCRLEMWINERERQFIKEYLKNNWYNEQQLLICINALASKRWKTKAWTAANYAVVTDLLASEFNARIVFTGTPNARPEIDKIIALTNCRPINAAGETSLMQLAALIERCSLLLSIDSAPLHIAAALKVPFVALFGPTDPARHLPAAENFTSIKKDMGCAPCYKPNCFHRNCMKDISADEVFAAIKNLLKAKTKKT